MDDTYYKDPFELYDQREVHDIYLKSYGNHSRSYVFKFDNLYGAHIICEPQSVFTINPLIFYSDYCFDTTEICIDPQDSSKVIKARSGLSLSHVIDILLQIKELPPYVKTAEEIITKDRYRSELKNIYKSINRVSKYGYKRGK